MVITKDYLRQLIKEELEKVSLEEEQVEENIAKATISAGVGILFGLLAAKGVPDDRAMATAKRSSQLVAKIDQKMQSGQINQSGTILDDPAIATEVDRIAVANAKLKDLGQGVLPQERAAGMSMKMGGKR